MLRIVDLAGAVEARGWPAGLAGEVMLDVDDPICPWNSGRHLLVVDHGSGRLGRAPHRPSATTVTPGGLAVLFAGGVPVSELRRAGLVEGGEQESDHLLDAAFAGPRPAILDYF